MNKTVSAALAMLLLLVSVLAACGSDTSGSKDAAQTTSSKLSSKLSVSGDVGAKPEIKIDGPLKVTKSVSDVLVKGDGATVADGKPYVVQITLAEGATGKTAISTYDSGQAPVSATAGQGGLFPVLEKALVGQKVGSRVVVEAAPADAYGDNGNEQLGIKKGATIVMVADIVGAQAADPLKAPDGDAATAPAGAPKVVSSGDKVTGVTVTGAKPAKLVVTPVVDGKGAEVKSGNVVTVNYFGVVYGGKKAFDESYSRGEPASFPIGTGGVIKCWDQGLEGVKVGSRVVLTCPADIAYGAAGNPPTIPKNATLTFVVDVLAAG